MSDLNAGELYLLRWLGESDASQYGECHGKALDSLIRKGLAQVHGEDSGFDHAFIAKGTGLMYRAVSLTEEGFAALREAP